MQDLTITLIQSRLFWEDPDKNLEMFEEKISGITQPTDLIILPEMFNTGFTENCGKFAEEDNGKTIQWLKALSRQKGCVITGSLIIREDGRYFNRLIWMNPDGSYYHYNKGHLFMMEKEHLSFSPGNKRLVVDLNGWKVITLICYDLRFPVWCKNSFRNGEYEFDLMIFIANWPAIRSLAWKSLLPGRAIENQSYVVGVNRVGSDGNNIDHSGDSMAVNPEGQILFSAEPYTEFIKSITLSHQELEKFRKMLQVGLDWDDFKIINYSTE
jgi:predicted amidohydrolase